MNTRNAPLSPVSIGGSSEWSGPSKYQADGLYPNNRGLVSPPDSGSPSGTMNGFPGGPRSVGGPSPPPSVGRSSTYARSESGRSIREENTEPVLGEHYVALRRYLASTSKDGRANPPPNKARDKLLRLSSVQFLELSTDVFDELMRRQIKRPPPGAPPNAGPPPYLLPEPNFHPKRNQARQKLSTLGSPRFRDLATDVFCELERRIPALSPALLLEEAPLAHLPGHLRAGPGRPLTVWGCLEGQMAPCDAHPMQALFALPGLRESPTTTPYRLHQSCRQAETLTDHFPSNFKVILLFQTRAQWLRKTTMAVAPMMVIVMRLGPVAGIVRKGYRVQPLR